MWAWSWDHKNECTWQQSDVSSNCSICLWPVCKLCRASTINNNDITLQCSACGKFKKKYSRGMVWAGHVSTSKIYGIVPVLTSEEILPLVLNWNHFPCFVDAEPCTGEKAAGYRARILSRIHVSCRCTCTCMCLYRFIFFTHAYTQGSLIANMALGIILLKRR